MDLNIRRASKDEAAFIARNILYAMDIDTSNPRGAAILDIMTEICAMDDTLYSWRNALVAELDGTPAGSITAYDGGLYPELSKRTFEIFAKKSGGWSYKMDAETKEGEYYLDSLAVLPSFRGLGLGKQLLVAAMEEAEALGFYTASLIVDPEFTGVVRLYSSCGFSLDTDSHSRVRPDLPAGHLWCFDCDYLRMTAPLH